MRETTELKNLEFEVKVINYFSRVVDEAPAVDSKKLTKEVMYALRDFSTKLPTDIKHLQIELE